MASVAALRGQFQAQQGICASLWMRPGEALEAFTARVRLARQRLPDGVLLVAVGCPGAIRAMDGVRPVELPTPMLALFGRPSRYRVAYGGRAGARSWSMARALIVRALERQIRVTCLREFLNSISESIHRLLADQIQLLGLSQYFTVQNASIEAVNGSTFTFGGIATNPQKLKSSEGIDIAYIEEAEAVSERSWGLLIPTIRRPGSEIWAAFNPRHETDPTYKRFITDPPPNAAVVRTSFADNPWLSNELREELEYQRRVDIDGFNHIWLGECRNVSAAQVFAGEYVVDRITPSKDWTLVQGCDFGFNDPSCLIRAYAHDNRLFVTHEAWATSANIDGLPSLFSRVPDAARYVTRADGSRPDSINYLKSHGFPLMQAAAKGPGSVEEGIAFLKSFEKIIAAPECKHFLDELRLYSYRVDRLTGDPLPELVDKHNHLIDSLRYAVEPLQKRAGAGIMNFYTQQAAGLNVVSADPNNPVKQPGQSPHRFVSDRPEANVSSLAPTVADVIGRYGIPRMPR
jgi:phage terminase large subunit